MNTSDGRVQPTFRSGFGPPRGWPLECPSELFGAAGVGDNCEGVPGVKLRVAAHRDQVAVTHRPGDPCIRELSRLPTVLASAGDPAATVK
jgi:hypothetical protein